MISVTRGRTQMSGPSDDGEQAVRSSLRLSRVKLAASFSWKRGYLKVRFDRDTVTQLALDNGQSG
jgi:hypothetical protein